MAVISACFSLSVAQHNTSSPVVITSATLCFGGVAACTTGAPKTAQSLVGRPLTRDTLAAAQDVLASELVIPHSVPGGMPEFRRAIIQSLFFKYYVLLMGELGDPTVPPAELESLQPLHRGLTSSTQVFEEALVNKHDGVDTVGKPVRHTTALEQVLRL